MNPQDRGLVRSWGERGKVAQDSPPGVRVHSPARLSVCPVCWQQVAAPPLRCTLAAGRQGRQGEPGRLRGPGPRDPFICSEFVLLQGLVAFSLEILFLFLVQQMPLTYPPSALLMFPSCESTEHGSPQPHTPAKLFCCLAFL